MRELQDKSKNPKIGRPIKTEKGLEFKKEYQINETKFELECQLLVTIHENYFVEPPCDAHNRRVEIDYITALFEKYDCIEVYEVLLKLNEFYYKNSSVFPEDKLRYTSLIDVAYMFKQLKINVGHTIRTIELVLTIIFYLYNEKLVNYTFYEYIESRIEEIANGMVGGKDQTKDFDKIMTLVMVLVLQIAAKEEIRLKK